MQKPVGRGGNVSDSSHNRICREQHSIMRKQRHPLWEGDSEKVASVLKELGMKVGGVFLLVVGGGS